MIEVRDVEQQGPTSRSPETGHLGAAWAGRRKIAVVSGRRRAGGRRGVGGRSSQRSACTLAPAISPVDHSPPAEGGTLAPNAIHGRPGASAPPSTNDPSLIGGGYVQSAGSGHDFRPSASAPARASAGGRRPGGVIRADRPVVRVRGVLEVMESRGRPGLQTPWKKRSHGRRA